MVTYLIDGSPCSGLGFCRHQSARYCLISLLIRQEERLRMLSCMRTSRIPSWIDDCGGFWVSECLIRDMSIWQSSAALEMPISQYELVIVIVGHPKGAFEAFGSGFSRYDCCYCRLLSKPRAPGAPLPREGEPLSISGGAELITAPWFSYQRAIR